MNPNKPRSLTMIAIAILFLLFRTAVTGTEPSLVIASAGVQSAEDAPNVAGDYKFLPGETLYASFQVAGFKVNTSEEKNVRSIALAWEVSARDADNVLLAEPESGEIKTDLSPEDKNWSPKRRVSFALPSFVAAGEYHLHVVVKDLDANVEASKDLPFLIGGTRVNPTDGVQVQHLRFSRSENGPALELPAYRPGDPVFVSFDMAGFSNTTEHEHALAYGISVLRPDGKPFLDQPNAGELRASSFYPAKFMPGNFQITTTPSSARGTYVLILTVKDLIAGRTSVTKQSFTLE